MADLSSRPTYNGSQLIAYLSRLNVLAPHNYTIHSLLSLIEESPLTAISQLQRLHLSAIPWGNVALHYSPHRTIPLSTSFLYKKIITRGLGGYCMELNLFFATVLRSLGYQLYLTAARISNGVDMNGRDVEGYGGWQHMISLVTIEGKKYVVDVGFGSQGALGPILLQDGETVQSVPGLERRVVRAPLKASVQEPKQEMWVYQMRDSSTNVWRNGYCFSEMEFFEEDFVNFNYRTYTDPRSWFTYRLVMTRVLLAGGEGSALEAEGTVTLMNDTVTRRGKSGKSEVLKKCTTENERVLALRDWFGVRLEEEEVEGIRGLVTEIRPPMGAV